MRQNKNVFNDWQKFCSVNKFNRETARNIYVLKKEQIKASESNWLKILEEFNRQRKEIIKECGENDLERKIKKHHDSTDDVTHVGIPSSVITTLTEIKSLLLYLSSEPVRHVRSFIKLEDGNDHMVHERWRKGICSIMSELKADDAISFKRIFELLREHLIDIDLNSMAVKFLGIDDIANTHFQVLFKKRREEFYNEIVMPVIISDKNSTGPVTIYMLYSPKEIFSIIESAYSTETTNRNSVLTTIMAENLEKEFFITRIIYFILHAMLHLKCALKYGNSFMTHKNHEYFDMLQVIVPPSLYMHFLQPYTAAVYNNNKSY